MLKLKKSKIGGQAIVMAIPRGGVVVGAAIARNLKIPLSIIVVKKLGAPGNSELAIGAIASDDIYYLDQQIIKRLDIDQKYIDEEVKRKKKEVEEKRIKYQVSCLAGLPAGRHGRQASIKNQEYRHIILVDDGIATGATVLAAIKYIKDQVTIRQLADKEQKKIILATPVIARDTYDKLESEVNKIVALEVSDEFFAVGQFYREFTQVTDEQVIDIIKEQGTWNR